MNNLSFQGINIANTNVLNHKLGIYKLTENDKPYIKYLKENIDLKKLFPQIKDDEYQIYDSLLKRALDNASNKHKDTLLLSCDNTPCGIMVYTAGKFQHILDYICTWPVEPNKKAPFGGQILFTQMFKNFIETGSNLIELYATRFGSAVSKYRHLGFKSCGGDNYTELMRIKRNDVENSYNILKEKFNLIPQENNSDLNLFEVLKIK